MRSSLPSGNIWVLTRDDDVEHISQGLLGAVPRLIEVDAFALYGTEGDGPGDS